MGLRLSEGAFKSSCSQPLKELRFPGIDMAPKYYETVYNCVCTDQKSLKFIGVCLFLASILISDFTAGLGFLIRHHHATPAVEYKSVLPLVEIHV